MSTGFLLRPSMLELLQEAVWLKSRRVETSMVELISKATYFHENSRLLKELLIIKLLTFKVDFLCFNRCVEVRISSDKLGLS